VVAGLDHSTPTEVQMSNLPKALTGLAFLAFVLAVLSNFMGPILNTPAEAYSRACSNLALLAIALVVCFGARELGPGRTGSL
jgi:predicted Kef-type K+ transport protein